MNRFAMLAVVALMGCSTAEVTAPALNASQATELLKNAGWTITEGPIGTRPTTGCIIANNRGNEGRFCVKRCESKTIPMLFAEFGKNYGYHVGEDVECELYMVFAGSPEMRRLIGGEQYMEPFIPAASAKLIAAEEADAEAPADDEALLAPE